MAIDDVEMAIGIWIGIEGGRTAVFVTKRLHVGRLMQVPDFKSARGQSKDRRRPDTARQEERDRRASLAGTRERPDGDDGTRPGAARREGAREGREVREVRTGEAGRGEHTWKSPALAGKTARERRAKRPEEAGEKAGRRAGMTRAESGRRRRGREEEG